MKTKKIMVLIGPGGCGKTTFAREYIVKNAGWVRVNRDDIRRQMLAEGSFGEYFQKDNLAMERHVTNLQMEQIRYWLSQGMSVIVDNPHLKRKYIQVYLDLFGHTADIIFTPFTNSDLLQCKQRILDREGMGVDVSYIDRHFHNFEKLLGEAKDMLNRVIPASNPMKEELEVLENTASKDCVIVNIDGTAADFRGIRSPNDGDRLHLDRPISQVRYLLNKLKSGFKNKPTIIYLSGREEKWREATVQWLRDHDFPWDGKIYMRKTGDSRSDYIVKTELLMDNVAGVYKPIFSIDDRHQVVHNVWYKLGIFCLNVNQGLRIF
jgi:predicted kinase